MIDIDAVCGKQVNVVDSNTRDVICIGRIEYNKQPIIGRGSGGTLVFKGRFKGREVAVKRIVNHPQADVIREIKHLKSLDHENIGRYYDDAKNTDFTYIALTLAQMSLHDYVIGDNCDQDINITKQKILKDCCSGLDYLHHQRGVKATLHRDIKPHNILLMKTDRGDHKAMLTDFGISKTIVQGVTPSDTNGTRGTRGWVAPELLAGFRHSRASDVFSMGLVTFFIFTDGLHPFGGNSDRQEENIRNNNSNLTPIADKIGICYLVQLMICESPEKRPSIAAVLKHPVFWDKKKRLQFIVDYSNRTEGMDRHCEPRKRLETDAKLVMGGINWISKLNSQVIEDLSVSRSYVVESLFHLVRAIRNKANHFYDGSFERRELYVRPGGTKDELFQFFDNKFPPLVHHCYVAAQIMRNDLEDYYAGASYRFPFRPWRNCLKQSENREQHNRLAAKRGAALENPPSTASSKRGLGYVTNDRNRME